MVCLDDHTAFFGVILNRFFNCLQNITYQEVPVGRFFYFQVLNYFNDRFDVDWARENLPGWPDEITRLRNSNFYNWTDEPYRYEPHPGGMILMRGGFGDIAAQYLPLKRCFLICPSQAEVDVIKLNRPDLTAHSITDYYRENPQGIACLTGEITRALNEMKDDPLLGGLAFRNWFKREIPGIVRMLDAVRSLFDSLRIGAVITISSLYSMDGALNLIARVKRIPSFTLQHGLIVDHELFCHVPVLATKKLVWGEATRQWYQKFGFPESRVSVVGSPRFDTIFNRKWCGREQLLRMLGTDPAKKIVVYAAQVFRVNQIIAPLIFEGLRPIPDLFLVMLLHPGEDTMLYKGCSMGFPNCQIVRFGQISLYDALSGADYFITYYSTAALEAMLFQLPVITVEPAPPTFSFGDSGASIRVTDSAGLNQAMRRLISDRVFRQTAIEQYRQFLSEYCIPDGLAGRRLFDQVETVCNAGGID
jgi:hypothetical protein